MNIVDLERDFLAKALACAQASASAYQSATIESDLAHVLILPSEFGTIIAFRGTANVQDVFTDAKAGRTQEVHSGFLRSFQSINAALYSAVQKIDGPITWTGHSKGGAETVLAAFSFARPGDSVYTFGQPRVGSAKFAAACDQKLAGRHFRFVNQEDIVPRVPLWITGYSHSGQEIFFPSVGGMRIGAPIWLKLLSDIYGTYLDYKLRHQLAQIEDHHVAEYVAKVYAAQLPKVNNVPALLN